MPERRKRQPASGQDWTGYKHIRVFQGVPAGDLAYHRANELAPGAVLPTKWGGVATARAIDPRLTLAPEAGQKNSSQTEIYTEWTDITTISGWPADFWTPYETRTSGGRVGTLQNFEGERTCIILDSQVATLASHYNVALGADHVFPGASGMFAAHLTKYRLVPMSERPLCTRLTLVYTEPTVTHMLQPGRAILQVRVSSNAVKQNYDDNGAAIEGPDPTVATWKWVLVSGSNLVLKTEAVVRIKTAGTSPNIPTLWSKIGKLNSNTFTNIGNAPSGTMRLTGGDVSGVLINRQYWEEIYELEYRPLNDDGTSAFGGQMQSLGFTKKIMTMPVQKDDGARKLVNDGAKTSQTSVWVPDAATESRIIAPQYTDMSEFDGWLAWTN